jgi:hypothetical protein
MSDHLNDFKENCIVLMDNLMNLCESIPELTAYSHKVGTYKYFAEKFINFYPEKVITQFILHILPFKEQIDEGNEDFFLKDMVGDSGGKKIGEFVDNDTIKGANVLSGDSANEFYNDISGIEIFRFEEIWEYLTENNKECIKEYMQLLCYYADEYFKQHM